MPPIVYRYDRRRLWHSLAFFAVFGLATSAGLAQAAGLGRGILARLFVALGLPPGPSTLVLGIAVTLAIELYVAAHTLRRRDEIRLLPGGLRVTDSCGVYLLPWDEIAAAGERHSLAGIQLHRREALLAHHQGTPEQRELLATREPFGPYDLAFSREQLDRGLDTFLADVDRFRRDPRARAELGG